MKLNLYLASSVICSALALSACQTAPKLTIGSTVTAPTMIVSFDSDGDGVLDEIDECPETPPNIVVDAKGCQIIIEGGDALEMEFSGFFPPMSSQLPAIYDAEFAKMAEKINEYPEASVFVFGHAASNEMNEHALATSGFDSLARNRVLFIKNTLVLKYNIDAERIRTYDCANKILATDTAFIDPSFEKLNVKNIESKQRRATLMASSSVKDLMNLKYKSDIQRYGGYAKHCELFE